jgi:hypothetical protein
MRPRQHGTDRIFNVSMGTLYRPILMGRVGSSKEVKDFLAATKLPSKIHPKVFRIDRGSGTLGGKPFGEPPDGRSLGAKSITVKYYTKMVGQECVKLFRHARR